MIDTGVTTAERIIQAATDLLAAGGRMALTTRAVSAAAGVQPPAIYRQFGDMQGLLDAVTAHGFASYLREKTSREPAGDPVENLRRGWDLHVSFGLTNPALYALMYGDPRPDHVSPAAREAADMLRQLVVRVAEAGRLRVDIESAVQVINAAGTGVTLRLLAIAPEDRDLGTSVITREAIMAAVTIDPATDPGDDRTSRDQVAQRAIALQALLAKETAVLSGGERTLLMEWLDRLARKRG